jgi:hypothetical protein
MFLIDAMKQSPKASSAKKEGPFRQNSHTAQHANVTRTRRPGRSPRFPELTFPNNNELSVSLQRNSAHFGASMLLDLFRISDFGFRPSFGLRPSAFDLRPSDFPSHLRQSGPMCT